MQEEKSLKVYYDVHRFETSEMQRLTGERVRMLL